MPITQRTTDEQGSNRATRTGSSPTRPGIEPRDRLLAGLPVDERQVELAGVSTALLEGGAGDPLVLLHGPGGSATHWLRVIGELVATHRVIVPDLPGQGASEVDGEPLDAERVLDWLDELIERTCTSPPALVGYALGGAIAARFAVAHDDRLDRLVLVDALGLAPFEPAPEFGRALGEFLARPSDATHDRLWQHCAFDLDGLREGIESGWEPFRAYNLDRARTPAVQASLGELMGRFAIAALGADELDRITVPVSLIWGRHDRATRLEAAEAVSARHGWPLRVIEDCADDPPIERPAAFLEALSAALSEGPRR